MRPSRLIAAVAAILLGGIALAICVSIPPPALLPPPPPVSTNEPNEGLALSLPIEVLGPADSTETMALNIPVVTNATTLFLKIHGLTYEGKASIRFNTGAWFTLRDSNVTYPTNDLQAYGMGGVHATLRMTVPITNFSLVAGTNQFQAKFNDLDGRSIGYRILSLDVLAGTNSLLPTNSFVVDNPATWVGPSTNALDILEGQALWYTAQIGEGTSTNILKAHCTSCHPHDGRDLKYFNYSNKSIIERSIYHKLTRAQGEKIASYIRSLNVPFETNGAPWNPPYQPGPGLDALPLRSWAAGAGLGWVLEDDQQTLAYLFPGGATTNSINLTNSLPARLIPLALQLPDWNHWLPITHPLDQYPTFETNIFLTIYATIRSNLVGKTASQAAAYFASQRSPWDNASSKTGIVKPSESDPGYAQWAEYHKAQRHWRAVKVWEIMTEPAWELQDKLPADTFPNAAQVALRRWYHGEVFRLGPHVIGTVKYDSWHAESMQWYQAQLVLNDGNRDNAAIVPIDWGYQHSLPQSAWKNPAGYPWYAITVLNIIKGAEVTANGLSVTNKVGWNPFKADTYRLANGNHQASLYAKVPVATRRAITEAVILPWVRYAESFSREEYLAAGDLKPGLRDLLGGNYTNFLALGINTNIANRIWTLRTNLFPL